MVVVLTHTTFATSATSCSIPPDCTKCCKNACANSSRDIHKLFDTDLASVFSMTNVYTCIVLDNVIHPSDGFVTVTRFLTIVIGIFLSCILTSRHERPKQYK